MQNEILLSDNQFTLFCKLASMFFILIAIYGIMCFFGMLCPPKDLPPSIFIAGGLFHLVIVQASRILVKD